MDRVFAEGDTAKGFPLIARYVHPSGWPRTVPGGLHRVQKAAARPCTATESSG